MTTRVDLSDDTFQSVTILWSKKYECPIYKVGDKMFIEETGEYAGYFDEVEDAPEEPKS